MVDVDVVAAAPGWRGRCSMHGELPVVWLNPLFAALDAIGHGTTHHRRTDWTSHAASS